MTMPRLAIIGAGALSTRRIYPNIGAAGASLAAACDLDLAKAQENCARWGGTAYTDWERMLAEARPDGVIVCIDGERHAQFACTLLERGIPVYTEKPPAPDLASAQRIAALARSTGTPYMCAFKKRYCASSTRAAQWLAGFPRERWLAYGATYASGPYDNTSRRRDFLYDFAVHHLDLVQHLMGPVASVFALHQERCAWMLALRFAGGGVGSLHLNCGRSFSVPTETVELTVAGGNAMTIVNSSSWRIMEGQKCSEWREPPTFTSAGDSGRDTGHLSELEAFVAIIKGDRSANRSDADAAVLTMRFFEAVERSAAENRSVEIG